MTIAKNRLMTLEEYLDYDDGTDRHNYELEDGVLIEMAPENPLNNTIVIFLVIYFSQLGLPHYRFATNHHIQVTSEVVSARQPDLIVHSEASFAAILDDARLLRLGLPAPTLVVEVVSSSDTSKASRDRDYVRKRSEYAQRGISEYWVIDPIAAVVLVLTLTEGDYQEQKYVGEQRLRSLAFPNVELSAAQVLKAGL